MRNNFFSRSDRTYLINAQPVPINVNVTISIPPWYGYNMFSWLWEMMLIFDKNKIQFLDTNFDFLTDISIFRRYWSFLGHHKAYATFFLFICAHYHYMIFIYSSLR